ncbi:hypothetical protein I7I53_01115 [Histoplasma capsulatum var. duboisii H88]|uniref:Uncharacterized protein n=1 Tax=Ajellomyces capsulatus (strain H88) TaxID=544711 RepID=A0A8A1LMU5_AJEC8|nr:hypothetical protein I7I53_01115 [Histoplasma capsulatum var. duboisii H88]
MSFLNMIVPSANGSLCPALSSAIIRDLGEPDHHVCFQLPCSADPDKHHLKNKDYRVGQLARRPKSSGKSQRFGPWLTVTPLKSFDIF